MRFGFKILRILFQDALSAVLLPTQEIGHTDFYEILLPRLLGDWALKDCTCSLPIWLELLHLRRCPDLKAEGEWAVHRNQAVYHP